MMTSSQAGAMAQGFESYARSARSFVKSRGNYKNASDEAVAAALEVMIRCEVRAKLARAYASRFRAAEKLSA